MDVPFFDPANLTGFGAFLTLAFWNVFSYMSGRAYSRKAVVDMQTQYENRIAEGHLVSEMWRTAYQNEVAARDLRWSAVGTMVIESTKTVAHALEAIQAEARGEVGHVHEETTDPTTF